MADSQNPRSRNTVLRRTHRPITCRNPSTQAPKWQLPSRSGTVPFRRLLPPFAALDLPRPPGRPLTAPLRRPWLAGGDAEKRFESSKSGREKKAGKWGILQRGSGYDAIVSYLSTVEPKDVDSYDVNEKAGFLLPTKGTASKESSTSDDPAGTQSKRRPRRVVLTHIGMAIDVEAKAPPHSLACGISPSISSIFMQAGRPDSCRQAGLTHAGRQA